MFYKANMSCTSFVKKKTKTTNHTNLTTENCILKIFLKPNKPITTGSGNDSAATDKTYVSQYFWESFLHCTGMDTMLLH